MIKEYSFEVLFGVQTDTFDILGLPSVVSSSLSLELPPMPQDLSDQVKKIATEMIGKQNQSYPPYSSARVNGKPLFQWARDGKLDQITIPTVDIEIFSLELVDTYSLE